MHTYVHQDVFQNVHSSTTHSSQSQNYPKSPLPAERVNKWWSVHTREQYKDEHSITTCNNVGDSQTVEKRLDTKNTCCIISFIEK